VGRTLFVRPNRQRAVLRNLAKIRKRRPPLADQHAARLIIAIDDRREIRRQGIASIDFAQQREAA